MIFDSIERLGVYSKDVEALSEVAEELKKRDYKSLPAGLYYTEPNKILLQNQEYETVTESKFEVHKKFIDVHIVLEGEENYEVAKALDKLPESFEEDKDIGFFDATRDGVFTLKEGAFVLSFPNEPHRPRVSVDGKPHFTKKIVVKIPY